MTPVDEEEPPPPLGLPMLDDMPLGRVRELFLLDGIGVGPGAPLDRASASSLASSDASSSEAMSTSSSSPSGCGGLAAYVAIAEKSYFSKPDLLDSMHLIDSQQYQPEENLYG